MAQYGFYINSAKCTGCKTCSVSCKDKKDLDVGPKLRRVYEYGGGTWVQRDGVWQHDVYSYYVSIACNHCDEPACAQGCPTGAMTKREQDGLVVVDQDRCVGCRYCEMRCPYGAPQFDAEKKVMSKCDGCFDLLELGKSPVCVEACPQRAIEFGPITELRQKYGQLNEIAPLPIASLTKPNLVIHPHSKSRPSGDKVGAIQNRAEV